MGVYLREKKLGAGQVSFYLDIYHNKRRWYEFLEIKINKNHPTQQDKEKRRLVQEIRAKRENELIVQDNGLIDKGKRKVDFVVWFEKYMTDKKLNYAIIKFNYYCFKEIIMYDKTLHAISAAILQPFPFLLFSVFL